MRAIISHNDDGSLSVRCPECGATVREIPAAEVEKEEESYSGVGFWVGSDAAEEWASQVLREEHLDRDCPYR